jgi:hypothetical protein
MENQQQIQYLTPFFNSVAKRLKVVRKNIVLNSEHQIDGPRYKNPQLVAFNLYQHILQDLVGLTPEQIEQLPDDGTVFSVEPKSMEQAMSPAVIESGYYDELMTEFLHSMAETDRKVIMDPKFN